MSNPLVGITAWRRELDTYLGRELLHTLSNHYPVAVINAGMTPVMFPNGQDPAHAARLVGLVDGLLLSGGDDVDPGTYGAVAETSKGHHQDVDAFEIALVQAAREQNKPVLAICRGLQLLNVALGGTLNQEVTREGTAHEPISEQSDPDALERQRHPVHFEPGALLADFYGTKEIKTNSLHHQGIGELSPSLIVEGRTEDGLVEAARCSGDWWALGVQWHPERMDSTHQEPLFGAFRAAISR